MEANLVLCTCHPFNSPVPSAFILNPNPFPQCSLSLSLYVSYTCACAVRVSASAIKESKTERQIKHETLKKKQNKPNPTTANQSWIILEIFFSIFFFLSFKQNKCYSFLGHRYRDCITTTNKSSYLHCIFLFYIYSSRNGYFCFPWMTHSPALSYMLYLYVWTFFLHSLVLWEN